MAQAGRNKKVRKRRAVSEAMVMDRTRNHTEAQIRRGVVPGAEPEDCPVCNAPSEGWLLEAGKRTWYHFGRKFNCVERLPHMPG